jgi:hypothetical protein
MTNPSPPIWPSPAQLHDLLIRTHVEYMSRKLLGMPYSDVQKIIYPHPPYKAFVINKRSGAPRIIHEPRRGLKELQVKVLKFLETNAGKPKPCVHGFTPERSIVTNALKHCSPQTHHLLNIDLQDFFPSIGFFRVRGVFRKAPFSCSHSVATVLAHLCTYQNELPQGAPTSPILANLVCRRLDSDLMDLARRHRATYTRYADDITFSFSVRNAARLPENVCTFDSGVLSLGHELESIVVEHNFKINSKKSRLSTRLRRIEVTGITINEFPNVKRDFIDRVRGALRAWRVHGYELAQAAWEERVAKAPTEDYENRAWKRQRRTDAVPKLVNVLRGRLLYIKMVRGGDDVIYTRLAERYNGLCEQEQSKNEGFAFVSLPIEPIVRNAQDAERAVFVVEWMGDYQPQGAAPDAVGAQGTAFAYRSNNCLVTCDHVFRCEREINGKVVAIDFESPDVHGKTLTVHIPSENSTWEVKVVHRDLDRDLAILEFVDEPPQIRHFVGLESPIRRNEKGVLIGYPNWNAGREANQVSSTVVSSYGRRGLRRFEISTNIRQGNSGGPFVDELYRVAGVAQEGATQVSGNDECLSVGELDAWISQL